MAELCDGSVVFYAEDRSLPIMAEHRAKGGRVVFTRDERIVLASGDAETLLRRSTVLGSPACSLVLENVLAAAATAWALGIDPDLIGAGIETYEDSVARTAAAVVS
jgi:cyanophycin synthetase